MDKTKTSSVVQSQATVHESILVVLISFIVGNFNVSLSLNVLNDLICRSADGDLEEFTSLQTSSEIFRVVASVLICPIVGFISDILMNFWKKYKNGSIDVLYSFPCYIGMTATAVGLGVSLIWTNIWPTMAFIAFLNGLIYTFENMCIVQSSGFIRTQRTEKTKRQSETN